jgi:SAM-dependent methyltransferase
MLEYSSTDHPGRIGTIQFLSKFLFPEFIVLDLGCSSGDLTKMISSKVKRIDGIDYNINSINQAKIKYTDKNISFIYGDAIEHLKYLNIKYDIIIMSHLLEHIESPELFLKEYLPFTLYFYIEVPDFEKTYHNIYRTDVGSKLIHTDDDHVFEFDREEIEDIFKKLNLTIIAKEFRFGVMRFVLKTNN